MLYKIKKTIDNIFYLLYNKIKVDVNRFYKVYIKKVRNIMKVGVLVQLSKDINETFKQVDSMGIHSCQVLCWNPELFTDEMAELVKSSAKEWNIEISALWCGWSGPVVWNFYDGPHTLGLVPVAYRESRLRELKRGSDFAEKIGVTDMITHVGYIPEVPTSTEYSGLIVALKDLANYMKAKGQYFLFETGQETPITLRRTIEDIGTGNLGINLDPANLILYGKANPVDALDVFGEYVRNVHGKDGKYPTNGKYTGDETRLGEGKVNYPAFIARLKEIGYDGCITIEREISGDEQIKDILHAKSVLESLI